MIYRIEVQPNGKLIYLRRTADTKWDEILRGPGDNKMLNVAKGDMIDFVKTGSGNNWTNAIFSVLPGARPAKKLFSGPRPDVDVIPFEESTKATRWTVHEGHPNTRCEYKFELQGTPALPVGTTPDFTEDPDPGVPNPPDSGGIGVGHPTE